ncbi:hypothetical protein ABUE31_12045 [Mesorhizobium sp. ZMM04-5]|uniref:Lipoprotein n=1 Tax=Mesorhizobium marinum TaxID=3228790 RepID=A0ABV3R052_9HYPH
MTKWLAVCIVAAIAGGCTSTPAEYAATLSPKDPKWQSPQCRTTRAEAATFEQRKVSWAAGALLGPYGLAIAAAAKEHQEKQRRKLAREMHLNCSTKPLPKSLQRI